MKKEIEISGKTREEAIEKAVIELGAPSASAIMYTVINEGRKGFLGFGAVDCTIKAIYQVPDAPAEDKPRRDRRDRYEQPERLERAGRNESYGSVTSLEEERRSNKVVNIRAATQLQVVLVKPDKFDDASAIADHLREKRTVVLNLESTNKDVARRLIDFLSGVAYSIGGSLKKIASNAYVITPSNVDVGDAQLRDKRQRAEQQEEAPATKNDLGEF